MQEDFLHFIWQYQYFQKKELHTQQGQQLIVLNTGKLNTHSGADFDYAKIKLDGVEWIGTIEIHLKSSDWNTHQHQRDTQYNNVILHVVWEDNKPIRRSDNTPIPTLVLKNRVDIRWLPRYQSLLKGKNAVPCAKQIEQVHSLPKTQTLDRALVQRLETKAFLVRALLIKNKYDWEETAYQLLAKNFGFKINAEPFLRLSQSLPLRYLQKHRDQLIQIEASLFGQAGFLVEEHVEDKYYASLRREYTFLNRKYNWVDSYLNPGHWRFMRMRPPNFPTVRIAQFAALIYKNTSLFSLFLYAHSQDIMKQLKVCQSDYWQNHYHINQVAKRKLPNLGEKSIENIIINTVVPLLAAYAHIKQEPRFMDKALRILEELRAEDNKVLRLWRNLGWKINNAYDSQALLELHNAFCVPKKCLQCAIGLEIIRGKSLINSEHIIEEKSKME